MIDTLPDLAAATGGAVGSFALLKWLVERAVKAIDESLLRLESRFTSVESTVQRHGETLAVVAHELGIRNRKEGTE